MASLQLYSQLLAKIKEEDLTGDEGQELKTLKERLAAHYFQQTELQVMQFLQGETPDSVLFDDVLLLVRKLGSFPVLPVGLLEGISLFVN